MPAPSSSLSTLRPDLAASFMQFDLEMDRRGFAASRILPVIEVPKSSGQFGKIPLDQLLQRRTVTRAPGAGYSRGNFTFSPMTFATTEYGAEEPVDDREAALYNNYFDAEQIAALRAYDAVLREQEIRVAALIFNTTTWTGSSLTTAVSTPWSTAATCTPLDDVEAAVNKVYDNSGIWPNALVINRKKFRQLRNATQVINRIVASGAGSPAKPTDVTVEMLAQAFDLPNIIVAGSSKNSATEGQTASPAQIWGSTNAMVCRVAETNDIKEPCLGRIFHWAEDGSEIGGMVETYREESSRADIVRVRHDVQEQVLYTQMGHLLTSV